MRKFMLISLTTALCAFAAQAQTVVPPTTGTGADQVSVGANGGPASVNQTVTMTVPKATALHLDVSALNFDISTLGTNNAANSGMICVSGVGGTGQDTVTQLGADFWNQKQVLPLGTYYQILPGAADFGKFTIVGGPEVKTFPPIQIGGNGELVPNSKNYFVCYRSFILQKFSNGSSFDLTVARTDTTGANRIDDKAIYVQDNPCDTLGQPTGLYQIGGSESTDGKLHLIPTTQIGGGYNMNSGTTGRRTANNPARCGYKSWLDDMVVVAVKVDGEKAGANTATLQYTLATTW